MDGFRVPDLYVSQTLFQKDCFFGESSRAREGSSTNNRCNSWRFFRTEKPVGAFRAEWVGHGKRASWWELWGYSITIGGGYFSLSPAKIFVKLVGASWGRWGLLRPPILKKTCFQVGYTSKHFRDTHIGTVSYYWWHFNPPIVVARCKKIRRNNEYG